MSLFSLSSSYLSHNNYIARAARRVERVALLYYQGIISRKIIGQSIKCGFMGR